MTTVSEPEPVDRPVAAAPRAEAVVDYRSPTTPNGAAPVRSIQDVSRRQTLIAYAILLLGSVGFVIPFYFVVNGSLKSDAEVRAGEFITPPAKWADVHWRNYPRALAPDKLNFWPALSNTVFVTTFCVVGQILSSSLVGFGFSRFRFRGRGILFIVMLSTMMLPAQVTMIPVFVLFRSLGLIDTFWPLIIPAWIAAPFYVFMFRQFFAQIPEELVEAARIDGCSNWTIYWRLMLPLSGPVIAIVAIQTFMGSWNAFLEPLIYLNSPEHRTLTLALNGFKGQYGNSDTHLLMAATVVCMLPCVVLFFAAQKYFVESVAMTGLKS